ncbi:DUF2807 domain-containing protein [Rapidithrix thailandica]|uniref:DUF2807 domain-containing protein n=1 Tax=Rapidithrix thailandica TaxID=413964 RepID=A0AAW9RSM3_9BACT
MRNFQSKLLLLFVGAFLAFSCDKDDDFEGDYKDFFSVEDFDKVRISTNAKLILFEEDEDDSHEIKVTANAYLHDLLELKVSDNTLHIHGKDYIKPSDSLVIYLPTDDDLTIVVEADAQVLLEQENGDWLDDLALLTQGDSRLTASGLQVEDIETTLKGSSQVWLSSLIRTEEKEFLILEEDDVEVVYENALILDDSQLLIGQSIVNVENGLKIIGPVKIYHLTDEFSSKNSGDTRLYSFDLPTDDIKIINEGSAEAEVSPVKQLKVTGSGASVLHYNLQPDLDLDLSGSAVVEPAK